MKDSIPDASAECGKEPVHLIGEVQGFGFLVCVDPISGLIVQISGNVKELLSKKAQDLLFQRFEDEFFPLSVPQESKRIFRHIMPPEAPHGLSDFIVHHHINSQGLWVLEFLKNRDKAHDWLQQSFYLQEAVDILRNAPCLREMLQQLVNKIFEITSFKRVMVYKFDQEWNGEVVAEKVADLESYLGHHFPASDIPPQARDLFLSNWIRMIPDVDGSPAILVPSVPQNLGDPLDLKMSQLRYPSRIHMEYLKNMGVKSTLTLSLISQGKLWGLVACHHDEQRVISAMEFEFCQTLAQLTSSLLEIKIQFDQEESAGQLQKILSELKENVMSSENVSTNLLRGKPSVLELFSTSQTSTAFNLDGRWSIGGKTPNLQQIRILTSWLASKMKDQEIFYTDRLSEFYPPAKDFSDRASGLLAISMPKKENNLLLFFRPEAILTKTWAGNPEKSVVQSESGRLILHPRRSFEEWKEKITHQSLPWEEVEVAAALKLRKILIEIDLEKQFLREKSARADAETERKRFIFISQASLRLSASLEQKDIVSELGQLSTEGLCEWSAIRLYSEEEQQFTVPQFFHKNSHGVSRLKDAFLQIDQAQPSSYLSQLREGKSVFHPRVSEDFLRDWLQGRRSPFEFSRKIGMRSFLAVPIRSPQGKIMGVLEWGISESYRYFTQKDIEVAEQLALRAASALENSKLWSRAQKEIKMREDMVGIVSHDLKSPLTNISFNVQLSQKILQNENLDKLDEPLSRIGRSVINMRKLIDDLLSLTSIDAGKLSIDLVILNASELIRSAIELMGPTAMLRNIELISMIPKSDIFLKGDKDRLMQVFSNLLGNAIKFSPENGRVIIAVTESQKEVTFRIQDFGKGIKKEYQYSIFDQFWQENSTKKLGSGLGLSIAKGIIDAHKGKIWVESVPDQGSTFFFTLNKVGHKNQTENLLS